MTIKEGAVEKSFSKVFPLNPQAEIHSHGKSFDPSHYRSVFPERWAEFLRTNHRCPEDVAVFYDVTYRTARNWWDGINRPSGDRVAIAAVTNPVDFQKIMGRAT
ncbi:MAG: hypothetical protein ABJL99_09835 [Aliishimia sp.]